MVHATKSKEREIFLREFTKELIRNSYKEVFPHHPLKPEIEMPTVPVFQKIIQPEIIKPRVIEIGEARKFAPVPRLIRPMVQPMRPVQPLPITQPSSPAAQVIPAPVPLPEGFSLGKLDFLIADNRITSIECPGPGKPILVRSMGRANITSISLGEQNIQNIIEQFAQTARIPIIGGLFKAAIGNLVITAVLSDFAGSRFIINKYSPYSALEPATP